MPIFDHDEAAARPVDSIMKNSQNDIFIKTDFAERVRPNQQRLRSELTPSYDFIVCGSGSSGSVVAGRLTEDPNVSVLLLEAGGGDDVPAVKEANQWFLNLGSKRDWGFMGQPNPHLNGRSMPLSSMGKVLGGGSSINAMAWARGHKSDLDLFASEAGDPAWSYESVLNIYRRIEDWHGALGPRYRRALVPQLHQTRSTFRVTVAERKTHYDLV
jgi:choline dehydrogenase